MKIEISIKADKNKKETNSSCRVRINGETVIHSTSKKEEYATSGIGGALRKLTAKEFQIVRSAIRAWIRVDNIVYKSKVTGNKKGSL